MMNRVNDSMEGRTHITQIGVNPKMLGETPTKPWVFLLKMIMTWGVKWWVPPFKETPICLSIIYLLVALITPPAFYRWLFNVYKFLCVYNGFRQVHLRYIAIHCHHSWHGHCHLTSETKQNAPLNKWWWVSNALGFQTPGEEVWLNPPHIPKTTEPHEVWLED